MEERKEEMGIFDEEDLFGEEKRKVIKKRPNYSISSILVLSIGLFMLVLGARNFFLDYQMAKRTVRIREECEKYRNVEAKLKELKMKKLLVKSMIEKIKELQKNKMKTIGFFKALKDNVPSGVILSAVHKNSNSLKIEGFSGNADSYSMFIDNLNKSGFFSSTIEQSRNTKGEFVIYGNFKGGSK